MHHHNSCHGWRLFYDWFILALYDIDGATYFCHRMSAFGVELV